MFIFPFNVIHPVFFFLYRFLGAKKCSKSNYFRVLEHETWIILIENYLIINQYPGYFLIHRGFIISYIWPVSNVIMTLVLTLSVSRDETLFSLLVSYRAITMTLKFGCNCKIHKCPFSLLMVIRELLKL